MLLSPPNSGLDCACATYYGASWFVCYSCAPGRSVAEARTSRNRLAQKLGPGVRWTSARGHLARATRMPTLMTPCVAALRFFGKRDGRDFRSGNCLRRNARALRRKRQGGSLLDAGSDRRADALLEEALQVVAHRLGVAAAEAEAVALHGGQVRVDGPELVAGRLTAHLAQVGPDVHQVAVV